MVLTDLLPYSKYERSGTSYFEPSGCKFQKKLEIEAENQITKRHEHEENQASTMGVFNNISSRVNNTEIVKYL